MEKRERQLPARKMGIRNGSGEVSRAELAGQVSSRDADKVDTGGMGIGRKGILAKTRT